MNWLQRSILALTAVASAASAQVHEADFNAMTWTWTGPINWLATKSFQYAGDYGYYQDYTPSFGIPNEAIQDRSYWRYVYYTGLTGKRVVAWGDWGLPSVPSPFRDAMGTLRDGCQHTHATYGVWLQYGYYSGGLYYSGVVGPYHGGSVSGVRVNDYTCTHAIGGPETWGQSAFIYDFPKTGSVWQALILGAVANSHGAGLCGSSFQCINQPWLGAYTVSY